MVTLEETTEIVRFINGEAVKHPYLRSVTNMAISQVVPAWHIFNMLEGKKFKTQRRKADGKLVPAINMVDDQTARELFNVPKGKVKMLKADGSTEMRDMTGEERERIRAMRSMSQKPETEGDAK